MPLTETSRNQLIRLPIVQSAGVELWVKREDELHPLISGNKFRKLKYNIEEARQQRAHTLLTFGGAFSNHILATAAAAARAENNTTINKFIKNVESRIYANLSKQLVDNMFGTECETECETSGTAEVEGSTIYWVKDETTEIITLTITSPDGTTTTMSVPVGDFKF